MLMNERYYCSALCESSLTDVSVALQYTSIAYCALSGNVGSAHFQVTFLCTNVEHPSIKYVHLRPRAMRVST